MKEGVENTHCDVLIAGGGLAGACFACALRHYEPPDKPWNVVVVDNKKPLGTHPSFGRDLPTTALSASSIGILRTLGVWEHISAHAAPIKTVVVRHARPPVSECVLRANALTTARSARTAPTSHAPDTAQVLGAVVDTPRLLVAMMACLDATDTRWHAPASIGRVCARDTGGFSAQVGEALWHSDLLAVADGPHSSLRQQLGIATQDVAYGTSALLLNISTEGIAPDTAYEIFLEQGSLALLPIPSPDETARALLVRVAPTDAIDALMNASEASLLKHMSEALAVRGARLYAPSERRSRPLKMVRAQEQYRRGMVLVGDAAHSLHPIAAQGFNLTARDIDCLARMLCTARVRGEMTDSATVLARYVRTRMLDQKLASVLSDGLSRFFEWPHPLGKAASSVGFAALRHIAPLRRRFVRHAAGV